jgi:hypothetical protein
MGQLAVQLIAEKQKEKVGMSRKACLGKNPK